MAYLQINANRLFLFGVALVVIPYLLLRFGPGPHMGAFVLLGLLYSPWPFVVGIFNSLMRHAPPGEPTYVTLLALFENIVGAFLAFYFLGDFFWI